MDVSQVTIPIQTKGKWWVRPAFLLGMRQLVMRRGFRFRIADGPRLTLDLS